jgi:hypothetical protein
VVRCGWLGLVSCCWERTVGGYPQVHFLLYLYYCFMGGCTEG